MRTMPRSGWMPSLLGIVAIAALLVASSAAALAHGGPTVTVKEPTAAPGGTITVSGDGLGEKGQTVTITLRGAAFQKTLGTAILDGDTGDSFDDQPFTVPTDAPPGTYVIEAKNGSTTATAQIDVVAVAPAPGASAIPASSSSTIVVVRSHLEFWISAALVVLVALLALVLLWRSRAELTQIDG